MRGKLKKMACSPGPTVQYQLRLDAQQLHLNPLIGQTIRIQFLEEIRCQNCGRKTNKSFSQGYCYPCFKQLAECDICIVSPERCHHSLGTCRDPTFASNFCMKTHKIYLANSSGLKVGITRETNLPSRWLDQGAHQAMVIMSVASRYQSGLVEVAFKEHVSDRTHWQKLLKGSSDKVDLISKRDQLFELTASALTNLQNTYGLQAIQFVLDAPVQQFEYPVLAYPEKVKSHNLEKQPLLEGQLLGIKGQYLILDHCVINMRKYTGYLVDFSFD
jgi:hypothetical protein